MPDIEENELIARIEWNENIHVDENRRRVDELFKELEEPVAEHTASIGRQDFLLNRERELSSSEAELYFRTETPETISPLQQEIFLLDEVFVHILPVILHSASQYRGRPDG